MAKDGDEPDDLTVAAVPVAPPAAPQDTLSVGAPPSEALWADLLRQPAPAPLTYGTPGPSAGSRVADLIEPARRGPGFMSEISRGLDIWAELTPPEVREVVEEEITDAAVAVVPEEETLPVPEDRSSQLPEAVVEEVSEVDPYLGDGPFAAPMDSAPVRAKSFEAPRRPGLDLGRPPASQLVRSYFPRDVPSLADDLPIQRRVKGASAAQVAREEQIVRERARREQVTEEAVWGRTDAPTRRYPRMRALLRDPEAVPFGSEVLPGERPPPVPGTFFPAQRAPVRPPPAKAPLHTTNLDEMLLTMAEGLLIGESADGGTEVRVTLRDEFFAGTELRISVTAGRVRAVLVPPDRMTYFELNSRLDELRLRLEEKGLRVEEIRVSDPE